MLEKLLAKRHIRSLDFSSMRLKLMEKQGWNEGQAGDAEIGYRRFLFALVHKDRDDILSPPTQDIDEFWHQHILDTRRYRQDCDIIFGHYVDHTPDLDPESQRKADARRQELYARYEIEAINFHSVRGEAFDYDGGEIGASDTGADSGHSAHSHAAQAGGEHGCDSSSGHASDAGGAGCDVGSGDGGGSGGGGCGGG